jgi:hypothetical protein
MVMLIISEMLFQYRSPGHNATTFSRVLFFLFLGVVLFLGVCLSFVHVDNPGEQGEIMFLWQGCTVLVIATFIFLPAHKLLTAMKYPVTQLDDEKCVCRSQLVLLLFVVNFLIQWLYCILAFVGWNPAQQFIINKLAKPEQLDSNTDPASLSA